MVSSLTQLQGKVLRTAELALERGKGAVVGFCKGPLASVARSLILTLFARIKRGKLVIIERGLQSTFGDEPTPCTQLTILDEAFWVRVLLFGDLGFAESYMAGDLLCTDLTAFFEIFIANRNELGNATTLSSTLFSLLNAVVNSRLANSVTYAIYNISAHYDISNDMFQAFLSKDMTYSAAIFDAKDPADNLESAQYRKLDSIIDKAHIKSKDHVLEIGTGWGSFAIRAVQRTRCQLTSVTLSIEQKELAEDRIRAAGLEDNIQILLCDYRNLIAPRGGFDKIVSIEMIEAVGRQYLSTYFTIINKLLKKKGGIAVFQTITMPETRHETYTKSPDFIRKYIFPGGYLSTVSELVTHVNSAENDLIIDSIDNIGPHYSKTLRLWREAFIEHFDSRIKPALLKRQKHVAEHEIQAFRRKWEYYFAYCEGGFKTKTLGNIIMAVSREGAIEMMEQVPL